jgi:hypothetical protein
MQVAFSRSSVFLNFDAISKGNKRVAQLANKMPFDAAELFEVESPV